MRGSFADQVVVVTGASSGIGRATALAFARQGATVVLAARDELALTEVSAQCRELGARALAVPTDVTDEAAMHALAEQAHSQWGRVDVWVNNAGVTVFGRFEEVPMSAFRRVIETNLFGYVHGARAVLPVFRTQGYGVLINVASVAGEVAQPYTAAYVASKFAVRGLSESLRLELQDTPAIQVCTVLPGSIDTPLFQHGANYAGREPQPLGPVHSAEAVADAIVQLAHRPKREVHVGSAGPAVNFVHTVSPGLFERLFARRVAQRHFQQQPAAPTAGNLYQPAAGMASIAGGWGAAPPQSSHRWAWFAAFGGALLVALAPWLIRRRALRLAAPAAARLAPVVAGKLAGKLASRAAAKAAPPGTRKVAARGASAAAPVARRATRPLFQRLLGRAAA